MNRYSIENTKPVSRQKIASHHGVPVVRFTESEQKTLKSIFDFYIFFPLHGSKKKYAQAQKLFDKINLSVSTLKCKKIAIAKPSFNKFSKLKLTK